MVDERKKKIKKAREDLVERVSIAGWKEALDEHVDWIRYCYILILITFTGIAAYLSYKGVGNWLQASDYTTDINDVVNLEQLPFSNVTICAQLYFNHTFVRENLEFPKNLLKEYVEKTGQSIDEFYKQFSLFLSLIFRPRKFTDEQLAIFNKISQYNRKLEEFSDFTKAASAQCRQMFKKCTFGREEFDCCSNAVQSIDDDGICYTLPLNYDNDNAAPSELTRQQTVLGPNDGLTIELSVDLEHFAMLEDDGQNGFIILVDPTPYLKVHSPITAPHEAETFVKVTPTLHSFARNCAPYGKLAKMKNGPKLLSYDPEGNNCVADFALNTGMEYLGCVTPGYTLFPNSSQVCSPIWTILISNFLSFDVSEEILKFVNGAVRGNAGAGSFIKMLMNSYKKIEAELKSALHPSNVFCPSHCLYWKYESMASFSNRELVARSGDVMNAKINIYYADFSYREYSESKQPTLYLAFCEFGNVVGLYLGMSVVSFFHVAYYLLAYGCARRTRKGEKKHRIGKRKINIVHVAPMRFDDDPGEGTSGL